MNRLMQNAPVKKHIIFNGTSLNFMRIKWNKNVYLLYLQLRAPPNLVSGTAYLGRHTKI